MKIYLALCAAVGFGSLVMALNDPSQWGMWLTFIAMVLLPFAVLQRERFKENDRGE